MQKRKRAKHALETLRPIRYCGQWFHKSEATRLPEGIRGVYALLKHRPRVEKYDVVYIGMARRKMGVRARLIRHKRSKRKGDLWTHFSIFEVWPNITEAEIEELEGLFREIYQKDRRANRLNEQKGYKRIQRVRVKKIEDWPAERGAAL